MSHRESTGMAEQARNAALLAVYDYSRYPEGITGFNGMNLQCVRVCRSEPAVRVRVGPRGNYKGALCRLGDGTLVLAACRRINDAGLFGIHVYASHDRGLKWDEIGEPGTLGKEMSLTALPDGTLLMTVESKAFAADPTLMTYYRSTDRGRHWEVRTLDHPEISRNVIVEPDGSLLLVRSLRSHYWGRLYAAAGRPYEPSSNLELLRSTDGGESWTRREGRLAWDNTHFGEVSSARLPDGRLLAALRSNPPGTAHEGTQVTYLTESTDDGATWREPRVITGTAEVQANLLLLRDGRLLVTYTNYHLPFGVCAMVSDDNGATWRSEAPIQLALSADCFTGWPVTVELDGGELITSYAITAYLNEPPESKGAERNVCEVVRWGLDALPDDNHKTGIGNDRHADKDA